LDGGSFDPPFHFVDRRRPGTFERSGSPSSRAAAENCPEGNDSRSDIGHEFLKAACSVAAVDESAHIGVIRLERGETMRGFSGFRTVTVIQLPGRECP
jgi:hypothetical protein